MTRDKKGIYIQMIHEKMSDGSMAPRVLIQDGYGNDISLDMIDDTNAQVFMIGLEAMLTTCSVETPVLF